MVPLQHRLESGCLYILSLFLIDYTYAPCEILKFLINFKILWIFYMPPFKKFKIPSVITCGAQDFFFILVAFQLKFSDPPLVVWIATKRVGHCTLDLPGKENEREFSLSLSFVSMIRNKREISGQL